MSLPSRIVLTLFDGIYEYEVKMERTDDDVFLGRWYCTKPGDEMIGL